MYWYSLHNMTLRSEVHTGSTVRRNEQTKTRKILHFLKNRRKSSNTKRNETRIISVTHLLIYMRYTLHQCTRMTNRLRPQYVYCIVYFVHGSVRDSELTLILNYISASFLVEITFFGVLSVCLPRHKFMIEKKNKARPEKSDHRA